MTTFSEVHARNPYLSLLEYAETLGEWSRARFLLIKLVFAWSYNEEQLESAREALTQVKPQLEEDRRRLQEQLHEYEELARENPHNRAFLKHVGRTKHSLQNLDLKFRERLVKKKIDELLSRRADIEARLNKVLEHWQRSVNTT